MPASRTDLLSVTRTLLRWAFYIDIALLVMLAIVGIGVLLGDPSRMQISGTESMTPAERLRAARIFIPAALVCCALALPLLRRLIVIVDSARAGDPFVPENGVRLHQIGWMTLAIHVIAKVSTTAALEGYIGLMPISFIGLLTVLMIFVLARIFEAGSRMRAELQGTV